MTDKDEPSTTTKRGRPASSSKKPSESGVEEEEVASPPSKQRGAGGNNKKPNDDSGDNDEDEPATTTSPIPKRGRPSNGTTTTTTSLLNKRRRHGLLGNNTHKWKEYFVRLNERTVSRTGKTGHQLGHCRFCIQARSDHPTDAQLDILVHKYPKADKHSPPLGLEPTPPKVALYTRQAESHLKLCEWVPAEVKEEFSLEEEQNAAVVAAAAAAAASAGKVVRAAVSRKSRGGSTAAAQEVPKKQQQQQMQDKFITCLPSFAHTAATATCWIQPVNVPWLRLARKEPSDRNGSLFLTQGTLDWDQWRIITTTTSTTSNVATVAAAGSSDDDDQDETEQVMYKLQPPIGIRFDEPELGVVQESSASDGSDCALLFAIRPLEGTPSSKITDVVVLETLGGETQLAYNASAATPGGGSRNAMTTDPTGGSLFLHDTKNDKKNASSGASSTIKGSREWCRWKITWIQQELVHIWNAGWGMHVGFATLSSTSSSTTAGHQNLAPNSSDGLVGASVVASPVARLVPAAPLPQLVDHKTEWRITDLGDNTVTISCAVEDETTGAAASSTTGRISSTHSYLTSTAGGLLALTDEITGDGSKWTVTKTSAAGLSFLNLGAQKFLTLGQTGLNNSNVMSASTAGSTLNQRRQMQNKMQLYLSASLGPSSIFALSSVHGYSFRLTPSQRKAHEGNGGQEWFDKPCSIKIFPDGQAIIKQGQSFLTFDDKKAVVLGTSPTRWRLERAEAGQMRITASGGKLCIDNSHMVDTPPDNSKEDADKELGLWTVDTADETLTTDATKRLPEHLGDITGSTGPRPFANWKAWPIQIYS